MSKLDEQQQRKINQLNSNKAFRHKSSPIKEEKIGKLTLPKQHNRNIQLKVGICEIKPLDLKRLREPVRLYKKPTKKNKLLAISP